MRQPFHFSLLEWESCDNGVQGRGVFDSTSMSLEMNYGDYTAAAGGFVGSQCVNWSHQVCPQGPADGACQDWL